MVLAEIGFGEVIIGIVGSLSVAIPATIGAYATYRKVTGELSNNGGNSFKDALDARFDKLDEEVSNNHRHYKDIQRRTDRIETGMREHETRYADLEAYVHARMHQVVNQLSILIGSADLQNKIDEFRRMNQNRTRAEDVELGDHGTGD